MAKALMIQGTGSGAGKSLIVTALCRIFNKRGIKVAPFKAQNMALNSFVTMDGGEIGRAQALQAEAARTEPSVDMNPVLLKASGEKGCQVIVHGRVYGNYEAKRYYSLREELWPSVKESLERLSERYELLVIEGAGSPAEINLLEADIVNMRVAKYAKAPVLLVGDIDRGGVFASLYGTVKLLGRDARYIKAFVINKFRGDRDILTPGLSLIEEKTGRPVIGVIPYLRDIMLPEEDGLSLDNKRVQNSIYNVQGTSQIKIVVLRLPYISNFTDFDPLFYEPDVELLYSRNPADIENADIVIVPGTKNTVRDLIFLKENNLDESLKRAFEKGIQIIGICGGYQMLGKRIADPSCLESSVREIEGIGLLEIETVFQEPKLTAQIEAEVNSEAFGLLSSALKGYEIHMGRSTGDTGLFRIKRFSHPQSPVLDGSMNGNCWGTYIHGIFDNDHFRRAIINSARMKKGLEPLSFTYSYRELKEGLIDSLSKSIEEHIDMSFIWRLLK
ncbi:MAG: cobyric acid synthase [Thermodesulfovibrionales bacterium]|nr:cobyric acid synthase [Thermodesulfovibrionales bacterium]